MALVDCAEDAAKAATIRCYLIGLGVFALTVVGYTLIGGFLASVWTDMFQSVLMLIGVVLLFVLIVPLCQRDGMDQPTLEAVAATGSDYAFGPGFSPTGLAFLAARRCRLVFLHLADRRHGHAGRHGAGDGLQETPPPCAARSCCCRSTTD